MKVTKFLKDIITTGASQIGVLLFVVVLMRIMTLVFDEKNFGLFILIRRWSAVLLPLVTLNVNLGLTRYVSFDKEKARFYLHISLIITTALTVLMFIIFALLNKPLSIAFFNSTHYRSLVFLLVLFLFANMIHLIAYSYFRGKMDMNRANIMRLLFMGFPVLLGGIFFILGSKNYFTLLCVYFSVYALWGVILSLYFLRKECCYSRPAGINKGIVSNFKKGRNLFKYSLTRVPSVIFISLIFSSPAFIANYRISLAAAGYIGVVVAVLHMLGLFCMPFNLMILPKFSYFIKNNQMKNIKNYSLVILDFIFNFLTILMVTLYGLSRYIVLVWFGPKYLITADGVAIAILASVFYLGYTLIRAVLNGLYEFPFTNIINLAGFLVVVALCLLMGTGVFELSAALACGLFILGMSAIIILVKKLQLSIPWMNILKALLGCVILFLLLPVVDNMITGLNLNIYYTFALCALYRGFLLVLVWWFYWRKSLWYQEMTKRINFKDSNKEDAMVYGE